MNPSTTLVTPMFSLQHSQVRANPVVARTISQSSISTPIKTTPAITVKMPSTAPVTAPTGTATNVTTPDGSASRSVTGITVKQEPLQGGAGTQAVKNAGLVSTGTPGSQVGVVLICLHTDEHSRKLILFTPHED